MMIIALRSPALDGNDDHAFTLHRRPAESHTMTMLKSRNFIACAAAVLVLIAIVLWVANR